jgi:hypothetical protein
VNIIDRILAAFRRKASPPQRALPYRTAPEESLEAVLGDVEARIAGLTLRVKALEHQLEVRGEEPTPTPTGRDLLDLADFLDAFARMKSTARWNNLEIAWHAKLVRGLARYHH